MLQSHLTSRTPTRWLIMTRCILLTVISVPRRWDTCDVCLMHGIVRYAWWVLRYFIHAHTLIHLDSCTTIYRRKHSFIWIHVPKLICRHRHSFIEIHVKLFIGTTMTTVGFCSLPVPPQGAVAVLHSIYADPKWVAYKTQRHFDSPLSHKVDYIMFADLPGASNQSVAVMTALFNNWVGGAFLSCKRFCVR